MLSFIETAVLQHLRRAADFLGDCKGSTAIEYTIIVGLISVAIVASLTQISGPLEQLFADIGTRFNVD